MTKEQLAEQLNGREYPFDLTEAEDAEAKRSDLLVVFGASDDLCELRGAIHDELGTYQEALVLIDKRWNLVPEIEDKDVNILKKYGVLSALMKAHESCVKVRALWCASPDYSWTYATTAPHATFDVIENGEKYCRGIVIDMRDLKSAGGSY